MWCRIVPRFGLFTAAFWALSCAEEPRAAPLSVPSDTGPAVAVATATAAEVTEAPSLPFARGEIRLNLEQAVTDAVGPDIGPALTQVAKRVVVWWLDVRSDLRKGDTIELVYEPVEGAEPIVHALWFRSAKFQKTYEAVLFQPAGVSFPRWYDAAGVEVEARLTGGPIDEYEQITSLLSDGRGHRGVDFKAPVGTPVKAPFSGRIARVNWARRANGNCVDIRDKAGRRAYLLHLDSIDPSIRRGVQVKRGQLIGRSGNTGRSTAPHLHYQLQKGHRRVIDPFRFHKTSRRRLSGSQLSGMRARLENFQTLRTKTL